MRTLAAATPRSEIMACIVEDSSMLLAERSLCMDDGWLVLMEEVQAVGYVAENVVICRREVYVASFHPGLPPHAQRNTQYNLPHTPFASNLL